MNALLIFGLFWVALLLDFVCTISCLCGYQRERVGDDRPIYQWTGDRVCVWGGLDVVGL